MARARTRVPALEAHEVCTIGRDPEAEKVKRSNGLALRAGADLGPVVRLAQPARRGGVRLRTGRVTVPHRAASHIPGARVERRAP
jgi:hypothetical protein